MSVISTAMCLFSFFFKYVNIEETIVVKANFSYLLNHNRKRKTQDIKVSVIEILMYQNFIGIITTLCHSTLCETSGNCGGPL